MAATSKTMAEELASSSSLSSSNNNKHSGSSDGMNAVSTSVENKEDNSSSNTLIKTFPYLTITVYIPTACVGVLIGKRGSNIDSIQKLASKESTKYIAGNSSHSSYSRGSRNKSGKQNKNNNGGSGGNQKAVSPESVRISVVNYPPPTSNAQHQQNSHNMGDSGIPSSAGQQQQQQHQLGGSSMMDMGVPPTYTELDFSDPQWTPIVIRADPVAAIYAANAVHDICYPEYVVDRNQLIYIMDVPVPAVAAGNSNNANLRHASIVGKRGNKLIQLSADHKCRIMVPPKQLGHNVIQLEASLKECCSCLKAISVKLQAGSTSGNEENQQQQQHCDATKPSPANTPSKNNKSNGTSNNKNNNGNKSKNDNSKKNFQMTLIIQPLPSQTKLRNIARKTETKILKKRIPKSQRNQKQHQQPKQDQDQQQESKQPEQPVEEGEVGDQHQEKREQGGNNNSDGDSKVPWRLTVVANLEKKVMKAIDMLKLLNSKGYEVVVEELGANSCIDTSNKTLSDGVSEDEMDGGAGNDSTVDSGGMEGTSAAGFNCNNGRNGGRGGRSKKQRHRNNHRGNNGKDNNANCE